MGYNKITLYGNQVCDYLYIQKSSDNIADFKEVNSEPTEWNSNTLLFATFNGDDNGKHKLSAGDSTIAGSIVGYEIRRQKGVEAHSEYVGTIRHTDSGNAQMMIDYMAANNTDYTYYLYPTTKSDSEVILSPYVSDEVTTDWGCWSLLVVDETDEENVFYLSKMFKFELNLETGDMNNNAVISVTQNFTKYPTVQYGTSNYWSGDLTSLCGFIACYDGRYIQTPNMINELKALTSDTRRKFLKDMDGNVWEVKITAPINISTDDQTLERVKTVKISWAEVGDASGISIINDPAKPTTSWLLTEAGETVPYIDYIWDNNAIWDNSYVWTSNDDVLGTDSTNNGRSIYKEGGEGE